VPTLREAYSAIVSQMITVSSADGRIKKSGCFENQ